MTGSYWVENVKDADLDNLKAAAKKAIDQGNKVFILQNPNNIRTSDYIFERHGIYKDYNLKYITWKNSVENRLQDSIGQTRRLLLNMNIDYYNPRHLAKNIKDYFNDNNIADEVLIYKGKKSISVNKFQIESKFFIRNVVGVWSK